MFVTHTGDADNLLVISESGFPNQPTAPRIIPVSRRCSVLETIDESEQREEDGEEENDIGLWQLQALMSLEEAQVCSLFNGFFLTSHFYKS